LMASFGRDRFVAIRNAPRLPDEAPS